MSDVFDPKNEVQPQTIDWGMVGDFVSGTKVGQRNGVKTRFGENSIYTIKAEGGSFHRVNADKTIGEKVDIKAGEVWEVWGRGDIFDGQMNRMQIGQKFGLKFTESKPSTMGNDAKIIKVFTTGEMDTEWLESQQGNDGFGSFGK